MPTNDESAIIIHRLGDAVAKRNQETGEKIYDTLPALMLYPGTLSDATPQQMLELDGVDPDIAEYVHRVLSGEPIESVASDVPGQPAYRGRRSRPRKKSGGSGGGGEPDGSWDDAVRYLEGHPP